MSRRRASELAARIVTAAAPAACAIYGLARPDSLLAGGAAWLVLLGASLAGAGHLVERVAKTEVDLGLRMTWGAGAYLALAGVLLALGSLSTVPIGVLIALGYAGHVWRQWTTPRPALVAAYDALPRLTAEPLVTGFFALIVLIATVNVTGAIVETDSNRYDDDVAYTPLIKRVLQTGDIDEPFSFRRISAYGGQTALGALAGVRGTITNIYLVDAGLFQLIALLLVIGLARQHDRQAAVTASRDGPATDRLVIGFVLLVLVLLPNTSINTGTYWTGVVMFLGLYRTIALTARPDAPLTRLFAVAGGLAAAACTLRQNLIPVAVLVLVCVLLARLGREFRVRWKQERVLWLATIAAGALVLIPYCIASWRSNHTILFPVWPGTFNPDIPTQPTLTTAWQELQFFLKVALEPEPVRVMLVLLPVLFLAQDRRAGRPLTALTIASLAGFTLVVHSFGLSDQHHLWRYSFAFMLPLFIALVVECSAPGLRRVDDDDLTPVRMPLFGRVAILCALVVQLALVGRGLEKKYATLGADLDLATSHPARALAAEYAYGELQRAAPAGAPIAVALDKPFYLDYARNRIFNLDTPGFASLSPGMPFFQGPEPVAAYFLDRGIRHLAFVRGEASAYMYRREFWVRRIFIDTELWRVQGAYAVDCLDNFAALAESRTVLYERDGMVMLDLSVKR